MTSTTTGTSLTIDRDGDKFEVFDKDRQEVVFSSAFFAECLDYVFGKWETDDDD